MSKQIFKKPIPADMLFSLLDTICIKEENNYIFNNNSYKKGLFENSIPPFVSLVVHITIPPNRNMLIKN